MRSIGLVLEALSGRACSYRMHACPSISHPRLWLCCLPWHACVQVRLVFGHEITVRVSHPNLLCAILIHELCVVVFIAAVAFIVFEKQTDKYKKSKDRCEVAAYCTFAKNLSCQTIGFLEFLANLTPVIIMEERTKTIQHVNQIKH